MLDRILPVEDAEISDLARKAFASRALTSTPGTCRAACEKATASRPRSATDGIAEEIKVERVILAIGITGNVEGLGLEEQGVKIEKAHIVVDEWCRTGAPGLYAIGDVVGPPWLAHKASHEGVLCVEKIAGRRWRSSARKTEHPGLHLLLAAGRERRADRGGGARAGP